MKTEDPGHTGQELIRGLPMLHTTQLGGKRLQQNLGITGDVIAWCREKILLAERFGKITRQGKNWYILIDGCEITVNAHSYTVITGHRKKEKQAGASR